MYLFQKSYIGMVIVLAVMVLSSQSLWAHCQIPCGIYTDEIRFKMIEEDITTVEKSMNQIKKLSTENLVNYNQLVRWITNKDEHASKIQEIVDSYFLTQRIKPADPKDSEAYKEYTGKLALLHQVLFYAMKCKQTTDLTHVEKLRSLLNDFHNVYFTAEEEQHLKDPH
ncbi:MAG: superoxide dismutase [Calditrichia bacterium]|nr:superoxide dismutase [Calditrichia bacterium]